MSEVLPPPQPPVESTGTQGGSGLAIAALVLGICSVIPCIGVICGITAIVLAAVSLSKKRPGKGLAIGGLIAGLGGMVLMQGLIVAVSIFSVSGARSEAKSVFSLTHMKSIYGGLTLYAEDWDGAMPADLDVLIAGVGPRGYIDDPGTLANPRSDRPEPEVVNGKLVGEVGYVYLPQPSLWEIEDLSAAVLLHERPEDLRKRDKVWATYAGGRCEELTRDQLQQALARTRELTAEARPVETQPADE